MVMLQRKFFVLYFTAFLDLCAVSMITIQLPIHLRELGASYKTIGYIGSLYGFVQFFSSPAVANYAEKRGKKKVLVCILMLCGVGYLVLGTVSSLLIIALSRVYLGVFKHPLNLIQSCLADLAAQGKQNNESEALGYFQSASSLAFIIAPPIGGYLMQLSTGYSLIGVVVSLTYLLNTTLLYLFMEEDPQTQSEVSPKADASAPNSNYTNIFKGFSWSLPRLESVNPVLLHAVLAVRFLLSIAGLLWRNSYTILYKEILGLSSTQIGFIISFNAIVQTLIGATMKYIAMLVPTSLSQITLACISYALAISTLANISTLASLYPLIVVMSISTMVLKVSSVSFTHDILGNGNTATLIGLSASLTSIARLISPVVAGYLIEYFNVRSVLYFAASTNIISIVLSHYCFNKKYHLKSD